MQIGKSGSMCDILNKYLHIPTNPRPTRIPNNQIARQSCYNPFRKTRFPNLTNRNDASYMTLFRYSTLLQCDRFFRIGAKIGHHFLQITEDIGFPISHPSIPFDRNEDGSPTSGSYLRRAYASDYSDMFRITQPILSSEHKKTVGQLLEDAERSHYWVLNSGYRSYVSIFCRLRTAQNINRAAKSLYVPNSH